jgi:DnaK suppressor protein
MAKVGAAACYRPSAGEPYMNPDQLGYFKDLLQQWRRRLRREDQDTLTVLQRQDDCPADPIDRGVQETDRQFELANRIRNRQLLAQIDAALGRIEDGSYGFCLESGEEIGIRRLEILPFATLSIESQEQRERSRRLNPRGWESGENETGNKHGEAHR